MVEQKIHDHLQTKIPQIRPQKPLLALGKWHNSNVDRGPLLKTSSWNCHDILRDGFEYYNKAIQPSGVGLITNIVVRSCPLSADFGVSLVFFGVIGVSGS